MYFLHLSERHLVQPVRFRKVSSFVFLNKLGGTINEHKVLCEGEMASTFSSLPISSGASNLLGVVVSIEPSASTPGHRNKRCLPRRKVLWLVTIQ